MRSASKFDIIIIGGGMVGLTVACALAQQTALSIAVLEAQSITPTWSESVYHHRVSAIALSSQRIFQAIAVWDAIQKKRVSPFTRIHVWDAIKQADISFDSTEIAQPVLGYIVENNVMQCALLEKAKQLQSIQFISPVTLSSICEKENAIEVLSTEETYTAKLVIAADGAQSWVREAVGIQLNKKEYDQQAMVATVHTALPHEQTARQVFLETGPLAFLPLESVYTSSIVWSVPHEEANRLMALDATAFNEELTSAFSSRLGAVTVQGERYAFPLQKQQATHYVKSRIALVGDAAHTVHPLAGQGVNMGLLDAISLVEVIVDAIKLGRDFSSYATLRRYERWRKADNQTMLSGVDVIKYLFESDKRAIQSLRSFGLSVVNQVRFLKNIFSKHAVGERGGLPRILQ